MRHIRQSINNRQDEIISVLAEPMEWRKLTGENIVGEWVSAVYLQEHIKSMGGGSLAIARDISECRYHLAHMRPGWTITNRLTRTGGKTRSFYRIERRG